RGCVGAVDRRNNTVTRARSKQQFGNVRGEGNDPLWRRGRGQAERRQQRSRCDNGVDKVLPSGRSGRCPRTPMQLGSRATLAPTESGQRYHGGKSTALVQSRQDSSTNA